jgi:malonyl-CoA/methylmalonyl-CoA synthetase
MSNAVDLSVWVDEFARTHPGRTFLKTPEGRCVTYAALRESSGRIASALTRLGVEPGDRVAVQVDKSPEAVLLYLACLRMGAVFVPINIANTASEVDYFLRDSSARVAIIRPADRPVLQPLAESAGVARVLTLGAAGEGSLPELACQSDANFLVPPLEPHRIAAIVYTSGTTGRSKGAMLTRANLAANAAALAHAWRFSENDTLLHTLPLFHIHGLFVAVNTVLASGSGILLLPRFDAELVLKHLPEASVFMGVPTHYTRLLQLGGLDKTSATAVRLFVSGSAPLLAETHREFLERTGHVILERYGMTETLINTSNPYDGVRLPGSVGPPLQDTAIRVAAEGGMVEPQAGAIGELQIKGPSVFAGYWQDEAKTRAEFTADGWFKSGDVGCIDGEGYVHIVGRAKDLVISGGYNVYPKEVETELDAFPGVLESAVFGVPHPDFGEGVTATVVAKPGAVLAEQDIIEAVKLKLARYKVPKRIIFMRELPRNTMGKVQKNELRRTFAAIYSGQVVG